MNQRLISIYQPDGNPPPPEVLGPIMAHIGAWRDDLKAAGGWVFTGGWSSTPGRGAAARR
jgi:hypothetical protein